MPKVARKAKRGPIEEEPRNSVKKTRALYEAPAVVAAVEATVLFRAERMVTCHKGLVLTAFCSLSQVTSLSSACDTSSRRHKNASPNFSALRAANPSANCPCHKRSPGPPPILYETFCHTSQAHPLCAEKYSTTSSSHNYSQTLVVPPTGG